MFTEIARLTNNLCPIDVLGDRELRNNACGQFFCSPYGSVIGDFFAKTLLSSGREEIWFSFLSRKCKLRNAFPL